MKTIRSATLYVRVLGIAMVLGAWGCAVTPPQLSSGNAIDAMCEPGLSFSPGTIGSTETSDEWLRREYSYLLDEIKAGPIWCGDGGPETYRLFVLPTHAPAIVVTVTRTSENWRFVVSEYATRSENPPSPSHRFRLDRQTEQVVDDTNMKQLLDALEASELWTTRALYTIGGADGVAWSIEGRRDGRYSVITQARGRDDAFATTAHLFVKLSGLDIPSSMK